MQIFQNDNNNNPIYEVTLQNAFPISVQAVELSNGNEDIERITIDFAYEDFKERNM